MNATDAAARCYSALLALYPRRFRDDYRSDMEQLFRQQCTDEPLWRVGCRAALDLILTVPTQHLEARMNSTPTPAVSLLFAALAIGGVLLAVVGGEPASLIVGLCIAAIGGTLAVASWRRAAPVGPTLAARAWLMLLIGGLALIALVIAGSGLGIDAWYAGLAMVLAGAISMIAGSVLGVVQAATRRHRHAH